MSFENKSMKLTAVLRTLFRECLTGRHQPLEPTTAELGVSMAKGIVRYEAKLSHLYD